MYPVYCFGDILFLHCDVGSPTFYLASSTNLSASLVWFIPSQDVFAWVVSSTLCTSTCGCSTSWFYSFGAKISSTACNWSYLSREIHMAFSSSNFTSLLTTIILCVGITLDNFEVYQCTQKISPTLMLTLASSWHLWLDGNKLMNHKF